MAFWRKKVSEFEQMNQLIQTNPGITQAQLAQLMGVMRSTIARRLPSLEEAGYLYLEDDEGGLWPFRKQS